MRIHATYAMFSIGLLTAACTPTLVNYEPRVHVVQSGETLMYISWRHHVDFRDLARWNDLDNPDLILVGQRLFITAPESVQQGAGTPTRASPSPARSSGDARPRRRVPLRRERDRQGPRRPVPAPRLLRRRAPPPQARKHRFRARRAPADRLLQRRHRSPEGPCRRCPYFPRRPGNGRFAVPW